MPVFDAAKGGQRVYVNKDHVCLAEPGEGGLTTKLIQFHAAGMTAIEVQGTVDTVGRILDGVLPSVGDS